MSRKTIKSCLRPRVSAASLAKDLKVVLENTVLAPVDLCVERDEVVGAAVGRLRDFAYQPQPAVQAETVIVVTPEQLEALLSPVTSGDTCGDSGEPMAVIHFNPAGHSGPGWYAFREGRPDAILLADGGGGSINHGQQKEPSLVRSLANAKARE